MARGKYSPTVNEAYAHNQRWWSNYAYSAAASGDEFVMYDPEGFDSYGYDKNDVDRAGNNEFDYLMNDAGEDDCNSAYEAARGAWGFDGTKPVLKK